MVRFTVLASGSKGNCTVVTGGKTRILVDAGLSCRELFRRMRLVDEEPTTLDAIIITHEHSDHVAGLAVTARKLGIPVYFTEATHRAWVRWLSPRRQMTYAQWIEQCRQQAAARMAEADAPATEDCDPDDAEAESAETAVSSAPAEDISTISTKRKNAERDKKDPTELPAVHYFQAGKPMQIGDISVSPFTIPH